MNYVSFCGQCFKQLEWFIWGLLLSLRMHTFKTRGDVMCDLCRVWFLSVHQLDVMCISSAELSPVGYIISCVFMLSLIKEFIRFSCLRDKGRTDSLQLQIKAHVCCVF